MYVIRERMLRLGEDSDITDEAGQPVLRPSQRRGATRRTAK